MFNSEDIQSSLKPKGSDYDTANYPPEHDCNSLLLFTFPGHSFVSQPLLQAVPVLQRMPGPNPPRGESISPLISPAFLQTRQPLPLPQTPTAPGML